MAMDWVWALYKQYITKQLAKAGDAEPTEDEMERAFFEALGESFITILVQEPYMNSVRFKGLARGRFTTMMDLVHDPMGYLSTHYGGGKFKLNFHRGWHFVATQNFKPPGQPRWKELPEIEF